MNLASAGLTLRWRNSVALARLRLLGTLCCWETWPFPPSLSPYMSTYSHTIKDNCEKPIINETPFLLDDITWTWSGERVQFRNLRSTSEFSKLHGKLLLWFHNTWWLLNFLLRPHGKHVRCIPSPNPHKSTEITPTLIIPNLQMRRLSIRG